MSGRSAKLLRKFAVARKAIERSERSRIKEWWMSLDWNARTNARINIHQSISVKA